MLKEGCLNIDVALYDMRGSTTTATDDKSALSNFAINFMEQEIINAT